MKPPSATSIAFGLLAIGGTQCAPVAPSVHRPPAATTVARTASQLGAEASMLRKPKVIVFVWDGLRPDSVSPQTTPNLAALRDQTGVNFTDQHAAYPTFTMMNAAALATGAYPSRHGFYGNTEYQPGPSGSTADGKVIDFGQPVFTEDHGVLQALDTFYRAQGSRGLLAVDTLFQVAHAAGLRTAAVGKIGPAFLQDYRPDETLSVILDENIAAPLRFARAFQAAGFALPANSARYSYAGGQTLSLLPNNGKPSAADSNKIVRLSDGSTPDPRSALGSAHDAANDYLMGSYLDFILPAHDPDLSIIWLRNPDSTEHQFGPGSANYADALHHQDALLGRLQAKLSELGLRSNTDLIVVSDHGHSTVAGDPAIFPLRALRGEPDGHGEVGAPDVNGYSVSGEVRTADLLTRAGFKHVYDGGGCVLDPVLTGILKNGAALYPTRVDGSGQCLGKAIGATGKPQAPPTRYSLPSFQVETPLPEDAIVVAANGGSEYLYVLDHSPARVRALVLALQERSAYGAIFLRGSYGATPGTLPLSEIRAEGARDSPPTPDLIVSFAWDENAIAGGATGLPGTEYASAQRYRGMHGSFSPRDIHNTLCAVGPHFKAGFSDALPTANVDLAPTIAALLGLHFQGPDGRVLSEALVGENREFQVQLVERHSDSVHLRRTCRPDDPSCAHPAAAATYGMTLHEKLLTVVETKQTYTYFDRASVTREAEAH